MARGRIASKTKKKLNFLCFGDTFSGKSTFVSQFAYMHNEDESPMRVLYIDAESGSIDLYLDQMEANGVDLRNIYILYTQSLGEVLDYIDKVKNNEDFYEIDEDGEETDIVVTDAEGKPFRADAIVIDGVTVLHTAVQQGLLEFSKKRARVRAENNGLVGDEKLVAIEGSSLEIRDFGNIKYKAANLCLALLGTGVHSAITCRQEDEKVSVKGANGQFTSVPTGKKIPAGFKGIDYNMHTVIRFYRDETNNVVADVVKDRTGVHPNEILDDPTLLDWQVVIDGNKGRKDFVLKNNLSNAIDTEQEIYSAEVMSNASKSISKSEMEKIKAKSVEVEDDSDDNVVALQAKIKDAVNGLNPVEKKSMKEKLTKANLPTAFNKVTDEAVLKQILAIVSE
jgi:KaiC/GvpD/RAD55 family RecA-like ATPase